MPEQIIGAWITTLGDKYHALILRHYPRPGPKMPYLQAVKAFRDHVLPLVKAAYERDFCTDIAARQRAWRSWVGALAADGTITAEQYGRWKNPYGGR